MSKLMVGLVAVVLLFFIVAISVQYNQGIGMSVAEETGTLNEEGAGGTVQDYEMSTVWSNVILILLLIGAVIIGGTIIIGI